MFNDMVWIIFETIEITYLSITSIKICYALRHIQKILTIHREKAKEINVFKGAIYLIKKLHVQLFRPK